MWLCSPNQGEAPSYFASLKNINHFWRNPNQGRTPNMHEGEPTIEKYKFQQRRRCKDVFFNIRHKEFKGEISHN